MEKLESVVDKLLCCRSATDLETLKKRRRKELFKYGTNTALTASEARYDLSLVGTSFEAFAYESIGSALVEKGAEPMVDKVKGLFQVKMYRPIWRTKLIKCWFFEINDCAYSAMRMVDQDEAFNRKFLFHNLGCRMERLNSAQSAGVVLCDAKTGEAWACWDIDLETAVEIENHDDLTNEEELRKSIPWLDGNLTEPDKLRTVGKANQFCEFSIPPPSPVPF